MIQAKLFKLGEWDDANDRRIIYYQGKQKAFKNRQQMKAFNQKMMPLTRNYLLWLEVSKLSSFTVR